MTLIHRKRRGPAHPARASLGRTCRIELLERREVLSATNVFAQFTGILDPAVNNTVDFLEVSVSATELSMTQERAVIGFRLKAQHDADLNPSVVTIRDQHGAAMAPLYARSNLPGSTESFVLAELASGDYTIEVAGAVGSRSQYILNVFLAGDVNGNRHVDQGDLDAIRAAYGARVGSSRYNVNADVNRDGRISVHDFAIAERNAAYAVEVRSSLQTAAIGQTSANAGSPALGAYDAGGGPAGRGAAVVPQAGYNPNAPMRFYESTYGLVQSMPFTAQGHSAVFRASADAPDYVFDWIHREAGYNNSMLAYKVDDAIGSLNTGQAHGTVNPNTLTEDDQAQAAAYRDAALANMVTIFAPGERADGTRGHLLKQPIIPAQWEYYSIVVRQNGDSYYWFPFEHVNQDNYAHFQLVTYAADHEEPWYRHIQVDGDQHPNAMLAYKVEDLSPSLPNPRGYINDADFDDVVFQVNPPMVGIVGDLHAIEGAAGDTISFQLAYNGVRTFLSPPITVRFRIDWADSTEEGLHPDDFETYPSGSIFPDHVQKVAGTDNEYKVTIAGGSKVSDPIILIAQADELDEGLAEWATITVLPDPNSDNPAYAPAPHFHLYEYRFDVDLFRITYARNAVDMYVLEDVTLFGKENHRDALADGSLPGIHRNDIEQGTANCAWAASLIALVRDNPNWLQTHTSETTENGNKVFTVTLHDTERKPVPYQYNVGSEQLLDRGLDTLGLTGDYREDESGKAVEIWPQLYTRAMLQHFADIWHGRVWMLWPTLTAQDATEVLAADKTNQEVYDGIKAAFDSGRQVILGTKNTIPSSIEGDESYKGNLSPDHAYVVEAVQDGKVLLINPWGLGTDIALLQEHLSGALHHYFVLEPTPTD